MPNPSKPFILIVDDSPTHLSVLSKTLKNAGYKVHMAVDGEDAL
ncbi:MAG: hybrid sensor histidine kinase/response regulator, partial [Okeania sp. SIO2D1]|nr:hybrid sensor histidine kinase/response regulator [Okeania sp. SIO2D1]